MKCDCLVHCGDDPDIRKGLVEPCNMLINHMESRTDRGIFTHWLNRIHIDHIHYVNDDDSTRIEFIVNNGHVVIWFTLDGEMKSIDVYN